MFIFFSINLVKFKKKLLKTTLKINLFRDGGSNYKLVLKLILYYKG
jgi:hypothetical protein